MVLAASNENFIFTFAGRTKKTADDKILDIF